MQLSGAFLQRTQHVFEPLLRRLQLELAQALLDGGLVAALIFFGCAAMVFLRKDPKAAPAPSKALKRGPLVLAPARVTVATAETQRIWTDHERWLAQGAAVKARAA